MQRLSGKIVLILAICASMTVSLGRHQLFVQAASSHSEDLFAKYSVQTSYQGQPAPPVLTEPAARSFRTRIREGVAKGVVFADHYELAAWGCGARCISFAIIDAVTGKVYFFPATISQGGYAGELLTYKRNSRAIHVIGSLNEQDSADRWYVWNGQKFILVSKRPAVLQDDDGSPARP